MESLLLRNDFVDAQVLSAIWPLEFDRYKVLVVRVDHNGRIESFTSFRSEAGPVDEHGEWNGEELIFTLQVELIPSPCFLHLLTSISPACPYILFSGTTSLFSSPRATSSTDLSQRSWQRPA